MAIFPNFIGPDYESQSLIVNCSATRNWYPEKVEIPGGKNSIILYRSPGTQVFGTAPAFDLKAARGGIEVDGRYFRINGYDVLEILSDGSNIFIGNVLDDGNMAEFAANSAGQIGIASAGEFYCLETGPSPPKLTHVPISDTFFGADSVTYQDSYFIVKSKGISQFQISDFNNGLVWAGGDVSGRIPMPDSAVRIFSDRQLLWVYTSRQCQLWANTGDVNFPYRPLGGAYMEMGLAAKESLCQFDGTLIWIGQDIRGSRVCFRATGASPIRVSNHAVEYAWSLYSTVADAVAFTYQYRGHTFYRVTFPTANKTWEFDAESGLWTEPNFTDSDGNQHARQERDHVYCFDRHLCGIGAGVVTPGVVMDLTSDVMYDSGYDIGTGSLMQYPIVRDRISPWPTNENKRLFFTRFELEYQRGIGLDGSTNTDPQFMLRFSGDGSRTWGNELQMGAGAIGAYKARAFKNRIGYGRDPAFWVRTSAPVDFCLINAYVELDAGEY